MGALKCVSVGKEFLEEAMGNMNVMDSSKPGFGRRDIFKRNNPVARFSQWGSLF